MIQDRYRQEQSSNRNALKIICDNNVNGVMKSNSCRRQSTVGTERFFNAENDELVIDGPLLNCTEVQMMSMHRCASL